MVILKSVLGLVIGGWIGGFIGAAAWAIVGSETGETVGGVCAVLGIAVGAIIGFALPIKNASDRQKKLEQEERQRQQTREAEERQRQQAREAEERRQQAVREAELKSRTEHLSRLLSNARNTFAEIRGLVPTAERHLDRAEEEFQEGAFAPFWDEIEHATNKLAAYQRGIETIHRNSLTYHGEAEKLPVQLPTFNLPTRELPDGRPTAARLATIARRAQKNFQFATIYEQRKTNQILVAGFGTLASAIYAIGDQISSSLNDLSTSLHTSFDDLLDLTREHSKKTEIATNRLAEQSKQLMEEAAKQRQFDEKIIDNQEKQKGMLEKIRRDRKP